MYRFPRRSPKDAITSDWMNVCVWRFWFKTEADAKRVHIYLRDYFGLHPKVVAARKRGELMYPAFAEVLWRGREVRVRMRDTNWTPALGVLPWKKGLRVHFDNAEFDCEWFVFRNSVYDLTFDGKCDYSDRSRKCYLRPMSDNKE